ncbi:GNAT family N-acetyltransferase [Kitasatospora sp. NPDC101235]|uniref:GNAT family N-acetyltransferase n=1 Tax=Kitasatospora sp. NPDC101235 TaxID=3364101 RepID=UPI0037FAD753
MATHDLTITEAAPDDPGILQLLRDLDADLAASYPDEPCTGDARLHPDIRFLLAQTDGRPVGCCAVQPLPDGAAELTRLYIAPDARGHGIATRLLAEAERTATALGHPEIRLETGVHRPEAIALYTRAGYAPLPGYPPYQDKQLSRCYTKPLPRPGQSSTRIPGLVIGELSLLDDAVAAAVHGIGLRAYAVEAELIGFAGIPALGESLEEMRVQPLRWLGAAVNGRIVAFIAWQELGEEDAVDIDRVCVDPSWFRRGLASRLLQHLTTEMVPGRAVLVSTGADNRPAVELYERHGFSRIGTVEPVPGLRIAQFRLAGAAGVCGRQ